MRIHKTLTVEKIRNMPWKQQVGIIASEFSRINEFNRSGGGPGIQGCLERARELLSATETASNIPFEAAVVLKEISDDLKPKNSGKAAAKAKENYDRLMALWEEEEGERAQVLT